MIGLEFEHTVILSRGVAFMAGRSKQISQVLVDLKISGALPRSLVELRDRAGQLVHHRK